MRLLLALFISLVVANRISTEAENKFKKADNSNVGVLPKSSGQSFDFGHVYRPGAKNPNAKLQQDLLEDDIEELRNLENGRQYLKNTGINVEWTKKAEKPLGFSNPRDSVQYLNLNQNGNENFQQSIRSQSNMTLDKSKTEGKLKKNHIQDIKLLEQFDMHNARPIHEYFSRSGFGLVTDEEHYEGNWTTCKEFAKGAVFHPDDIINIEWLPFYIWSIRHFTTSFIHKFSYPTKKLVKEYKETFGPYLNVTVDWEQPKLLLKESRNMLLIAGDRKGLFYGISFMELPDSFKSLKTKLPVIVLRLKIIDPYLAMMYCDEHYATIMAIAGNGPETAEDKTAEADLLKFVGIGNPASRDIQRENLRAQYEKEIKHKEELAKYINVERPVDSLDPTLW